MSDDIVQFAFGDTTLTKVFVGGLAWETPELAMREHFEKYGEILEAVIISDRVTGRSKGYGFVTFKYPEAAKKACDDPTPIINGRRANCNLASLGARRPMRSANSTPTQQAIRPRSSLKATANQVQWYYTAGPPFHHQHHQAVPVYGYSPTYIATNMSYNQRLSYTGGSYVNGHVPRVYPGQHIVGASPLMPMYPFYHFHQSQAMGLAHIFPSPTTTSGYVPLMMSKSSSTAPNSGAIIK
ncbi:hypothetical protein K2173_011656 [Erythroxylum novogranatense]|uniref:RRM domain-containing protein n=1 Tax=Erythroxylum novogranatense TaxID=1862640 RepID=A0AAV8T2A3_9ROSI|nr:hypothetical protein K2173_011656 [Erythroxylum novogranatense]